MDFPGEMAFMALGHAYQFNPGVLSRIASNDAIHSISRSVANDHPLEWSCGLCDYGLDRTLNIIRLIFGRSNYDVGWNHWHVRSIDSVCMYFNGTDEAQRSTVIARNIQASDHLI